MGRSVSLFLVRVSSILVAGLLLAAMFGHAHAENLDGYGMKTPDAAAATGQPYGLNPLPPATGPAPANPYAPAGAFTPAPQQPMAAAAYPPAAAPTVPVQAAPYQPPQSSEPYGYRPDPTRTAQNYPQPTYQQPVYQQPQPQAATGYGYRPEMARAAAPVYPQTPAYPSAVRAPADPYAYYQGAGQAPQGTRSNPDYTLNTGDKVKMIVYGETDLSGDFTIDGSGNLSLPLVGQVRAAGYTAAQLEGVVRNALMQGYLKSPRVSIEVSTYRPFYIIGAVNRPGQYPYVDHMNAMNAIALAGGFTSTAVESVVFVRREGTNTEVEMPVDRSSEIRPGDVVKVHNTLFSDITSWISPISGVAASAATAAIIQ